MATAKPTRNRTQPSSKPPTPAQLRRDKQRQADQRTKEMADMAYVKAKRRAEIAIARQRARADAMRDAGIEFQPLQPQRQDPAQQQQSLGQRPQSNSKQQPTKPGRKPQKPGKPTTRGQSKRKPPTNSKRR